MGYPSLGDGLGLHVFDFSRKHKRRRARWGKEGTNQRIGKGESALQRSNTGGEGIISSKTLASCDNLFGWLRVGVETLVQLGRSQTRFDDLKTVQRLSNQKRIKPLTNGHKILRGRSVTGYSGEHSEKIVN